MSKNKILVLGHCGMLGNAVLKYFSSRVDFEVEIVNQRYPDQKFLTETSKSNSEFIINCIGKIPQKDKTTINEYNLINIELPIFLESLGKRVIHPSTDCEFSGNLAKGKQYSKGSLRDAQDVYGKSKTIISKKIVNEFNNTKIMRVSIIGHELKTDFSLLNWFLSQENEVNGYTNHFWNGITTLEWAKHCENIINDWDKYPKLNQYGTDNNRSKYELLNIIKNCYEKNIEIKQFETEEIINKCLKSDIWIKDIEQQLIELKDFYNIPQFACK